MFSANEKYDVFISYRREGGYETAKHLYDLLSKDGYKVSFDIDTLRSGDFDKQLLSRIEKCKDFVIIVDKHAFDRTLDGSCDPNQDWLRCELSYALKTNKNIVPIFLSGIKGFPEGLPDDVVEVCKKNGPEYSKYYFDDFYKKLKKTFLHKPSFITKKRILFYIALLFIILLGIVIYNNDKSKDAVTIQESTENVVNDAEQTAPDIAEKERITQIYKKFEEAPDLSASERVDIVDLIKTFDDMEIIGWGVLSKYTSTYKIIPLSDGVEIMPRTSWSPHTLTLQFIAKLTYKGKNLDQDIFGHSKIQHIRLYGPRPDPTMMIIDSGHGLSYNLDEVPFELIEDAGYKNILAVVRIKDVNYYFYKKNNLECWMVLAASFFPGGTSCEWIVVHDDAMLVWYLEPNLKANHERSTIDELLDYYRSIDEYDDYLKIIFDSISD